MVIAVLTPQRGVAGVVVLFLLLGLHEATRHGTARLSVTVLLLVQICLELLHARVLREAAVPVGVLPYKVILRKVYVLEALLAMVCCVALCDSGQLQLVTTPGMLLHVTGMPQLLCRAATDRSNKRSRKYPSGKQDDIADPAQLRLGSVLISTRHAGLDLRLNAKEHADGPVEATLGHPHGPRRRQVHSSPHPSTAARPSAAIPACQP
mmetsp:Transcript_21066/g.66602  ORF Transcript_21066/g.66602 Transcript_21066/m.66602 type:complete len:208 (+) Transcript_21066:1297-1920(+)